MKGGFKIAVSRELWTIFCASKNIFIHNNCERTKTDCFGS